MPVCRIIGTAVIALSVAFGAVAHGQRVERDADSATLLQRVGERVERYFARAQSLVCLETVTWHPLDAGFGLEAMSREIESELALAWDGVEAGPVAREIRTHRRVLRVNGRPPRPRDPRNCTTAEQTEMESAPLSMLLPAVRDEYGFKLAGTRTVKGRDVLLLDFVERARPRVESSVVEGNDDCINYSIDGGSRGRLWIDAASYDVLRLERRLPPMLDIPLPRSIARRAAQSAFFTLERSDTTIDFQPVTFRDPDEILTLPVSSVEMRITRGSGTPRLRTTTEYSAYRRFLTGSRILR